MGASSDYVVYKKINGVLKELGNEKGEISKIKSNEYIVKDLHKKTILELQELLKRQKLILKNKSFLSKLPDKGEKLRSRYKEIEEALNQIISKSVQENGYNKDETVIFNSSTINAFEWTKKIECTENTKADLTQSNADDVADPLELLATHSFDAPPTRRIIRNDDDDDDPALAIAKELSLLEIKDKESVVVNNTASSCGSNDSETSLEFSIRLLKNLELKEKTNPHRKQFKPFKPLKNSLHESMSNKILSSNTKKSSLWTDVSATGSFESDSHHVELISLQESLRLLGESQKKEKDHIYKLTGRSLGQHPKIEIGLPSSNDHHYRDSNIYSHILDDSDEEDNQIEYLNVPLEEEDEYESD